MINIIQIEELVYSRLLFIRKAEWIEMLSKQGVSKPNALLLDEYFLIEQTDYRFENGEYLSSERTVYNIDYVTYDIVENAPSPENTEVIVTVHYNSEKDMFYVYHTHYISIQESKEEYPFIFSEADAPSSPPSSQSPDTKSTKQVLFTYNNYEFKWYVRDKILLDELFSGPTTLIGNPTYQFRRKALFVFMKSDIANKLGQEAEYEIPANTVIFMRKYQKKYISRSPRIFLFVCDDGKMASFYDEVGLVRANKNSITIKSLLRI